MSNAPKGKKTAGPVAESAPVRRVYAVRHPSCPARLIEAYSAEEAAQRYRDAYNLHVSRPVDAEIAV